MLTFEQLVQTPEYWMETIQNDLYSAVKQYMEDKSLTQSQLAQELEVSKGYVSQVMNGNFNYTLKKLIELSLHVGKVPDLEFKNVQDYIQKEIGANVQLKLKSLALETQDDESLVIPMHHPLNNYTTTNRNSSVPVNNHKLKIA